MRNGYRNTFCLEKAEFKGMKKESREINVGAERGGGAAGGEFLPRRSRVGDAEETGQPGCDRNALSCLGDLKCHLFHISFEVNTWSQNG